MGEVARVPRHHAGMNIVAAEKIAVVIEDHLIIVVVVVKERNLDRSGIGLERSRHEGADHETIADPGGVR
jgi:hypothetical protein